MTLAGGMDRAVVAVEKRPRFAMAVLALLFLAQVWPWWAPSPDAASYLSMGRHLARGDGLVRLGSPHAYYAPGYAVIISPAFLGSDRPFVALGVVQWLLALALLAAVHAWVKRRQVGVPVLVTALVMTNAALWGLFRMTLSEIAFMAALMWSVVALERVVERARTARSAATWLPGALASALLLAVTCSIRYAGLLVTGGLAASLLVRVMRRESSTARAAAVFSVAALPAAALTLALIGLDRARAGAEPTDLVDHLFAGEGGLAGQIAEGLRLRLVEIARLLVPGMFKVYSRAGHWLHAATFVAVPVVALVAAGWSRLARETFDVLAWTCPLYVAAYVVWPFDQGTRFLVPLLPALWVSVAWFLRGRPRLRAYACLLLLAAHLCVAAGYAIKDAGVMRRLDARWAELLAITPRLSEPGRHVLVLGFEPEADMLSVLIDRPVARRGRLLPGEVVDPAIDRIVAPADAQPPPGFAPCQQAGSFAVLARF